MLYCILLNEHISCAVVDQDGNFGLTRPGTGIEFFWPGPGLAGCGFGQDWDQDW